MLNLEDIRINVQSGIAKDVNGHFTPFQFNNALLFAEIAFQAERLGLPEGYVPGKLTGQEAYPGTAKIEDDIRPYLKKTILTLDAQGRAPLPEDYVRRSSIDADYTRTYKVPVRSLDCEEAAEAPKTVSESSMVTVEVMFNKEYTTKKYHSFKFPTEEFPICSFYDFGIEVTPAAIGKVHFDYISLPKGAKWAYTRVGNKEVYDPANSIQLQCPVDCYPKIASYIKIYMTTYLGDESRKQTATDQYNAGV